MIKALDLISLLLIWGYILVFFLFLHSFLPLRKNRLLWLPALGVSSIFSRSEEHTSELQSPS